MNNDISMIILVVLVVAVLYFLVFNSNVCNLCGQGGGRHSAGCLVTQDAAAQVLDSLAIGCADRLRAVVRKDLASADDVSMFMDGGNNRLVIVTNVGPEDFVSMIGSNELQAVAMSSSVVLGQKQYIVMSVNGGTLSPAGAPTDDLNEAFSYLSAEADELLGANENNLVFYIDEDIPCLNGEAEMEMEEEEGGVSMLDDQGVPMIAGSEEEGSTPIEECCGRRY